MDKKTSSEVKTQFKEGFRKGDQEQKSVKQTRTFDELCKGQCYVVKERKDSFKLKPVPGAAPQEPLKHFYPGDKVKNRQGELLTVLVQLNNLVIVKEEAANYNCSDLTIIEQASDNYKV